MIDTQSQSATPQADRIKSVSSKPATPRIDIAANINIEAHHLTYQSTVYLGVADF